MAHHFEDFGISCVCLSKKSIERNGKTIILRSFSDRLDYVKSLYKLRTKFLWIPLASFVHFGPSIKLGVKI
jgi:hypothetical protein